MGTNRGVTAVKETQAQLERVVSGDMVGEPQRFIVETDAILGGGMQFRKGDIATEAQLGDHVAPLLKAGAIRPWPNESSSSPGDRISIR
jgi:hypothetical protein